ncbi:MAG: UDP-N-acetylglucosamine pyrophosphorylase [Lachnospiraceae bacterium]|nr:UDP-N-acetylglucosamine pyrophosphorylase [Lachnospiraceae bacterium]
MDNAKIINLYNLDETQAEEYLLDYLYPWEALSMICEMIRSLGPSLDPRLYEKTDDEVWIAKSAKIWENVGAIVGPCIIGERTEVRPGAYIRGNALVGNDCVVGNSTELKNVILFNHVQVPHYNYVGDSILGSYAHMGAGSITSNVKADRSAIVVKEEGGESIDTGLKKMGAMLGDHVEIGCNAVLNPGTVIGRNSQVYPVSCVRGVIPDHSIFKNNGEVVKRI